MDEYKSYLNHQGDKTRCRLNENPDFFSDYDNKLQSKLVNRLPTGNGIVLCLGSRSGGEIKAFRQLGWTAFGIDIQLANKDNVVKGDFHYLPFNDSCASIVYTNSFDHALKPFDLLKEIKRVLSATGIFILEAPNIQMFGAYEVLFWDNIEVIKQLVIEAGFEDLKDLPITFPFNGLQIIARKKL